MPVRILLVDDHAMVRDGLKLRLQQETDFAIIGSVATLAEAYSRLEQATADIVLMDVNLRGESGIEATRHITAKWPGVKVIILTGDVGPEAARDAMLAGAHGFLRKEDASTDLIRALRTVIGGQVYLSPDAATAVTQALLAKCAPSQPGLSDREIAVLKGLAEGHSYKEIAGGLHVSAKSVETYRARIVEKTGCRTRADLVRYAIRQGFVKP